MAQDGRQGRILAGRYRLQRLLGEGAHGTVYLAEDLGRSGHLVAFKVVDGLGPTEPDPADAILRRFRHPRWAAVRDSGTLPDTASFQAIEFIRGQSLDHLVGPQPLEEVWHLLEDGARVLGALHRLGLIHYDVTPGNLMRRESEGTPRFALTDGGLAHVGPVEGLARGTPMYMAPEVTEQGTHDHRADLYALGLVAFRMATGRDPIEGAGADVLKRRRTQDAPRASTLRPELPAALDDLLADLLARDPNLRPSDALALLARIDEASESEIQPFLADENLAAAEGGALVGREAELSRFAQGVDFLKKCQSFAEKKKKVPTLPVPRIQDPVLVLRGAPGCGASRLAEEMASRARADGVAVLTMTGREQTGDRRGPLRDLMDGLVTLGLEDGQEPEPMRLDLESRRGHGREERSHAETRAVELFVRTLEASAGRCPLVLVVVDYADLPHRERDAIQVLSRHLLARGSGGRAHLAAPVVLVVDAGSEQATELLIPDAPDSAQPVLTLEDLNREQLLQICKQRFPGFDADKADLERIHVAAEGRPGSLVSLLGEACRRADLVYESGRWRWNVDRLDEYDIQRGLSPVHAAAWRMADADTRRLLSYVSLVHAPLARGVAERLWRSYAQGPLPDSLLLRTVTRNRTALLAPANLAVRSITLDSSDAPEQRQRAAELLHVLDEVDEPESALDRARLAMRLDDADRAMQVLARHWEALPASLRADSQKLLREAVESTPELLESADSRTRLAGLLEYGPDTAVAAEAIADAITSEDGLETAEIVAATLQGARRYTQALSLIERLHPECPQESAIEARLWTARAMLLFELHRAGDARIALGRARAALRSVPDRRSSHSHLLTEFLMAEAQSQMLLGNDGRANVALRGAIVSAKNAGSPALRAQVLNNTGIVDLHRGDLLSASFHFHRALRLRRALGDVKGVMKTLINLGRLQRTQGTLVNSAASFQLAASAAQRFADVVALARALLFLARVYDQQNNARLAASTYQRVIQAQGGDASRVESARAAWELTSISAATGDAETCAATLRLSAQAARASVTPYARSAHHLCAARAALHLGQPKRTLLCVRRACRSKAAMHPEMSIQIEFIYEVLSKGTGINEPSPLSRPARPRRGEEGRSLWRGLIWAERVMRSKRRHFPHPQNTASSSKRGLGTSGQERRLLAEMILRVSATPVCRDADVLLAPLERRLAHTGERHIQARSLALRSTIIHAATDAARAQQYSRSVQLLDGAPLGQDRLCRHLPAEHTRAYAFHAQEVLETDARRHHRLEDQHALAHRLLVRHGCTEAPDRRVASALRRVLAATGRMNAGASLDDLLQDMTKDTREITAAERTCVVLVEAGDTLQGRVATSASAGGARVDMEDLSQTIIKRVLDSRRPLLQHDVFDDEELLSIPSITDLSLRSFLCVPMIRGETLYGVMYADNSSAAGSFDEVDLEVLSLFAEQAASALETHRLVADVQNSMDELKTMQQRLVKGERLRTMGELSSGVAHEFNNLLTSILARVQLICLSPLEPELLKDLKLIEKASLDAAGVVRRLQNFTREQRQGHFTPQDLAEICSDAVEFLRPLWSTRRRHGRPPLTVRERVPRGLMVQGDATELREVVTNLLKNALEALHEGGVIRIAARRHDGAIELRVEDDGPGIPDEIQGRIFDPFYTTKGERGTGLGLCLTQQIIERHGGEIRLESVPGEGAVFTIELPDAGSEPARNTAAEEAATAPSAKRSVLVVDDDENVRGPLCRFLKKSGYDVREAANGQSGLTAVRGSRPDLVLTDITMPVMDGLELCRTLGREYPGLPVVVMSGWASGTDPVRARRAGAAELLSKPLMPQQVTEALEAVAATTPPPAADSLL